MNGPHTTAMSFPLINCNSRNCLQNMFPLSTIWFSKWSHRSIMLKLGILWCSKHSKCWGISTWHITSMKNIPISTFPWPTNTYSDTLVFPRFFRGSSFLQSHYLKSLPGFSSFLPAHGWKFWTDISSAPGRGERHRPKNSWKNTKACRSDCMAHFLLLYIYKKQ